MSNEQDPVDKQLLVGFRRQARDRVWDLAYSAAFANKYAEYSDPEGWYLSLRQHAVAAADLATEQLAHHMLDQHHAFCESIR